MIDSKDILTLLSIPSEDVLNVSITSDTKDISYIDIELKDITMIKKLKFKHLIKVFSIEKGNRFISITP